MCGIAGIFSLNKKPPSVRTLKNMLSQIRYRGPDESGIYQDEDVGIGNVRLSVIDILSGQQPMSSKERNLWIVYNGEVFNYIELRNALEQKGASFSTDSDTEVILRYYEYYGPECLQYFNGQFAFALWDKNKEELFLARDRMGIRPLYYSMQNNSFVFGSEIKVVLESDRINAELDFQGIRQVFTYWTTVKGNTCFKRIQELPPGHHMSITKNAIKIQAYWNLDFPIANTGLITDVGQAGSEFQSLFEDAVRLRLRADVPVAAYLSGGIDSSATTYFIKKINHRHLHTFSIGFDDAEFDETAYQQKVARHLNTDHTSFTCRNADIAQNYEEVVWHSEFPLLRTAPVPMYLLSKNVRNNNIKVVITGEGADELLGGYNIFKEMVIRRFWARYPNSKYRPLLLKKLYPYIPGLQKQSGNMMKFF